MTETTTPTARTPTAEPRRFADYLATIRPDRTIEHQGRTFHIFDVDFDAWAAWVDPHSTVDEYDDFFRVADYVPSWSLWYAADAQDMSRWGSGETVTEAAHEAAAAQPGHVGRTPSAWPCDACGAEAGEGCRPWCIARPEAD